jgi:hypothetical protein
MSCHIINTPDGVAIVCRRGDHSPRVETKLNAIIARSPWMPGARVIHEVHGGGIITTRNKDAVSIAFDTGRTGTFLMSMIAKRMKVVGQ